MKLQETELQETELQETGRKAKDMYISDLMRKLRWIALAAVASGLALVLLACGSDPIATPAPTPVPPMATPMPEPTAMPAPTAALDPTATSAPEPTTAPDPASTSAPGPTVEPDPASTPVPEPTVAPDPTATSVPEPTIAPDPAATSVPEATVAPDPASTPAPEAMAAPDPTATSVPEPTTSPDPTATSVPEPTTSPDPTAALAPEATVAPTAASDSPEPMMSLETLVITPETTAGDLLGLLSEQETSCVQSAVGDAMYQLIQGAPFMMMAGGDISQAAPLFNCLELDNILLLGVALVSSQSEGFVPETRSCLVDVAREHPEAILVNLGMELPEREAGAAVETHPYVVDLYRCLSDAEKVEYILGFQEVADSATNAGRDILAVIPESEVACISEALTADEFAVLSGFTVHEAYESTGALETCISDESYAPIFVAITETRSGTLSEETRSCLAQFALDHPHYTALIHLHDYDSPGLSHDEYIEIAAAGLEVWQCMTEEELLVLQNANAGAFFGQ